MKKRSSLLRGKIRGNPMSVEILGGSGISVTERSDSESEGR